MVIDNTCSAFCSLLYAALMLLCSLHILQPGGLMYGLHLKVILPVHTSLTLEAWKAFIHWIPSLWMHSHAEHCFNHQTSSNQNSFGYYIYCHESGLWTSTHSPPEVTRSPHGLLHYTNCCTSPRTTVPIIHCTDDTHTAECTDYTHSWFQLNMLHKLWTSSLSLPSIVSFIAVFA